MARLAAWELWATRAAAARRRREAARGLGLLRLARGAAAFFERAREVRRASRLASITHVHAYKAALARLGLGLGLGLG